MSKTLTFSRTYPSYHPRKGDPTYFVEAILTQLGIDYTSDSYYEWLREENIEIDSTFLAFFWHSLKPDVDPKSHTIRAHKRPLKIGDWFNPKCWAGKPYNKTKEGYWQIKFAPDIEVKKVWDFEVYFEKTLQQKQVLKVKSGKSNIPEIATNDGLELIDFLHWFNKPFDGQIICWNEKIKY